MTIESVLGSHRIRVSRWNSPKSKSATGKRLSDRKGNVNRYCGWVAGRSGRTRAPTWRSAASGCVDTLIKYFGRLWPALDLGRVQKDSRGLVTLQTTLDRPKPRDQSRPLKNQREFPTNARGVQELHRLSDLFRGVAIRPPDETRLLVTRSSPARFGQRSGDDADSRGPASKLSGRDEQNLNCVNFHTNHK